MRKKIILACSVCNARNYTTTRNPADTGRMEMNKFCKTCNEYTLHRETK
ncbi:50S ribosomal protein L33 [Sporolactobacillus sp. THM7-4]|nr:50S ribosomal protein L33 [Sporolactobacillus sp. THM7-4]